MATSSYDVGRAGTEDYDVTGGGWITFAAILLGLAGTFNVLICDLTPGATYTVSGNVLTASSAGTIAVDISSTGAGSRLSVTRGTVAATAPGPATAVQLLRPTP